MKIQLDFDGTVVEHAYPHIGRANPGAMETIKRLQDSGHDIILNTYRANINENAFRKAIRYLELHHKVDLQPLTAVNQNKINPDVYDWDVIKQTNIIWIDDIATNIPLIPSVMVKGNMVDWETLNKDFIKYGIY